MPRGQKVSRMLATSSKFLVANAQFLVALATSQSQCRTLICAVYTWAAWIKTSKMFKATMAR